MNPQNLQSAQMEMRQRQRQPAPQRRKKKSCVVPQQWRYTVTIALRALIVKCHREQIESGCNHALQCARDLGLDVGLVTKYTHLEKKEDSDEN